MRWLNALAVLFLALVAIRGAVRLLNPLPSLSGRTGSMALTDTRDAAGPGGHGADGRNVGNEYLEAGNGALLADAHDVRRSGQGFGLAELEARLWPKLQVLVGVPERRLGLVSACFIPTAAGVDAFTGMARHGVEVLILTNSMEATDVPVVHSGYAKWRGSLLRAGVRLFELRGPPQGDGAERDVTALGGTGSGGRGAGSALHAQTFTVDGERIFIGSFNFDPRSADLNTELYFVIESPTLANHLRTVHRAASPKRCLRGTPCRQGRTLLAGTHRRTRSASQRRARNHQDATCGHHRPVLAADRVAALTRLDGANSCARITSSVTPPIGRSSPACDPSTNGSPAVQPIHVGLCFGSGSW